jgi:hypothetical protein
MKNLVLRICAGVFLLVVGYMLGSNSPHPVHAQSANSIPKSYGKFVAASSNFLYFEDSSGTIRIVDANGGGVQATMPRN